MNFISYTIHSSIHNPYCCAPSKFIQTSNELKGITCYFCRKGLLDSLGDGVLQTENRQLTSWKNTRKKQN